MKPLVGQPVRGTALLLAVLALGLNARGHTQAQVAQARVIRIATLAPRGSAMTRALALWNRQLSEMTDGQLSVQVYWGGSMGGERTMVRRMRIGQLDGASLTSTGLALIHRPVLVFQVPGVFLTYPQVDAVREAVGPEIAAGFEAEGYHLLGWGDAGRIRIFSQAPVRRPSDLRRMRPWVPRDDAVFQQVLRAAGATGVTLSVGEVFAGLRTQMIDVVPGTAMVVAGLQWSGSLRYTTLQSGGFLIGGIVIRRSVLEGLTTQQRDALLSSARENHGRMIRVARRTDERAFRALTRNRLQVVYAGDELHHWMRVSMEARRALRGRVVSADLMRRVERIAAENL